MPTSTLLARAWRDAERRGAEWRSEARPDEAGRGEARRGEESEGGLTGTQLSFSPSLLVNPVSQ